MGRGWREDHRDVAVYDAKKAVAVLEISVSDFYVQVWLSVILSFHD